MQQRWVYFFADGRVRRGPYPLEELRNMPLRPETMVWREGLAKWTRLSDVPELWAIFAEKFIVSALTYADPEPPPAAAGAPRVPQTGFFSDPSDPANPVERKPPSILSIASLVSGIAGAGWWCLPYSLIVGAPLSIVAVVCAVLARRKFLRNEAGGGAIAMGGLMLGVINLVICLIVLAILGWVIFQTSRSPAETPSTAPVG